MGSNGHDMAKLQRMAQTAHVFTPSAPVDRFALFAGRIPQVVEVVNSISQRGQHVVLYGERGVGKTSLANILGDVLNQGAENTRRDAVRINCNTTDDFRSIWLKLFRELKNSVDDADWRDSLTPPDPEDVRFALQQLTTRPVLILDELDRLEDDTTLSLLADTIKSLSDHSVSATLLLVGVADSIEGLIGEHQSIERALAQVRMPRMSVTELEEIIDRGLAETSLSIEEDGKTRIARLSEGLPHYTHLLSLHAAQRVVADDRERITSDDIKFAIAEAVENHSILSEYQHATRSPARVHLFAEVLIACALAPKDELGFFRAAGVRDPMSDIMGRSYDIPAFARHLNLFADASHGAVLQKTGEKHRFLYRFTNPLLQPYAILTGLSKGIITERMVADSQASPAPSPDASVSERLFEL